MTRILVVEDTVATMVMLREFLEMEGHDVVEAPDGQTALECVDAQKPDLMILDMMLPDLNGLDVLKKVRTQHGSRELPIIILTAYGTHRIEWESFTSEADLFLDKPVDPDLLVDWVNRLAQENSTNQAAGSESSDRENDQGLMSELRGLGSD